MPTTNTLTDARCRAIKPSDKTQKFFDGGGMFLAILPSGVKSWRMAYRFLGKQQTITFGPYPEVPLAQARAKRDEVRAILREGGDPMAARRARRAPAAAGITFREACEQYWETREDTTPRYRANVLRAFELHLWPDLGDKPIAAITRADVLAPLMRMDAAGKAEYTRKTRMWAGLVFRWAAHHDLCAGDPVALIQPKIAFRPKPQAESFAALPLAEVPEFMQRLALEGELQSVLACRLLALTWVRTNELRFWRWEEIQGDTWVIPAKRMKMRREHVVPLSKQALALLDILRARSRGTGYVFPAEHREDRPISENAVLALLARIGYKGRMTGHGLRTVASTWANENGWNPDAIERQLAHMPVDRVRAAYNAAQYLSIRASMLQAFADWLDASGATSVTPIV